jgi:hypothetical protein
MITNSSQGIVEMIQRKKDAYQSNPQALQQRYQQNKQLTDLLALQQLKTEKEAAARDIQLKMQQNPQTIAQQREQQVLGLIKQEQGRNLGEVTKQVGGVLGQRQKESMQRRKQMGMAQGGIVGFFEGGLTEEARRKLYEDRESPLDFEFPESPLSKFRRSVEKFQGPEYTRGTPEYEERLKKLGKKKKQERATAKKAAKAAKVEEEAPTSVTPGVELTDYAKSRLSDVGEARRQGFPRDPNKQNQQNQQDNFGIGSIDRKGLTDRFKITPPDVEVGTTRQDATKGILGDIGIATRAARDLDAVRADRMADVKDEMGLTGIQTRKQSQINRLRNQQQRLAKEDPFEAFIAGTVGAAQRGGPGGFAAGYIGKLSQQRAQQRQDLKDQFGIENELLNIEQTVLAKGIDSADKAERVLSEEKRAYASAMSQAATGDISAAEKEAERILDANIQNIKTELDLLGQETDRAIAAAELRGASRKEMQELLKAEMERRDALLAPVVAGLIDRAMVPGADTEALVNRAALVKGFILEQNNIFAREQDILRRLEALGVNVSSQRGASAQQQQRSALMDQYLKSQQ